MHSIANGAIHVDSESIKIPQIIQVRYKIDTQRAKQLIGKDEMFISEAVIEALVRSCLQKKAFKRKVPHRWWK